ncbi:MAG: hypothetical protein IPG19_19690, partial [Burkholderiales bacterium]|nr:hypothetical protein [Burkholderiales bacterium]
GQADAPWLGLINNSPSSFPAVQCGQWVKFAFNRPMAPITTSVRPPANAHDLLQSGRLLLPIRQLQTLLKAVSAGLFSRRR